MPLKQKLDCQTQKALLNFRNSNYLSSPFHEIFYNSGSIDFVARSVGRYSIHHGKLKGKLMKIFGSVWKFLML